MIRIPSYLLLLTSSPPSFGGGWGEASSPFLCSRCLSNSLILDGKTPAKVELKLKKERYSDFFP